MGMPAEVDLISDTTPPSPNLRSLTAYSSPAAQSHAPVGVMCASARGANGTAKTPLLVVPFFHSTLQLANLPASKQVGMVSESNFAAVGSYRRMTRAERSPGLVRS